MSEAQELYVAFIRKYRHDLIAYAKDIHGIELDRLQRPVAEAIQRGDRLITVRSGHGVGKGMLCSLAACWFANTRFPMKVVVTAPSAPQLWDALWPEIRARFTELKERAPYLYGMFEVLKERIVLRADPDNSFISPATSTKENPEAIAGKHSENVLLLCDEASGIPDEVFVSGSGSMSGRNAQTILTGNPTRPNGFFFRTHKDPGLAGDWTRFHIDGEKSPQVAPEFIAQMRAMFGEDSNHYRVRVRGEFSESDDESFIERKFVDAAMARDIEPSLLYRPKWGIDPARFGVDSTAFCERRGAVTMPIEAWKGKDTMQICGILLNKYRACRLGEEPDQILVDVIGLGAGIVDRLGELELPVIGVNVAESAPAGSRGYRLRDELWIRGGEVLRSGRHRLPNDPILADQLCQPHYEYRSDGTIKIESKDEMKKRGLSSPDRADAWLNTFAADEGVLLGRSSAWKAPLESNVRVL